MSFIHQIKLSWSSGLASNMCTTGLSSSVGRGYIISFFFKFNLRIEFIIFWGLMIYNFTLFLFYHCQAPMKINCKRTKVINEVREWNVRSKEKLKSVDPLPWLKIDSMFVKVNIPFRSFLALIQIISRSRDFHFLNEFIKRTSIKIINLCSLTAC